MQLKQPTAYTAFHTDIIFPKILNRNPYDRSMFLREPTGVLQSTRRC